MQNSLTPADQEKARSSGPAMLNLNPAMSCIHCHDTTRRRSKTNLKARVAPHPSLLTLMWRCQLRVRLPSFLK